MAGFRENITALGITIQPTPGVYNEPTSADLIAVSQPDNGSDGITSDDPTLVGSVFAAPRQFIGRRGRAGATFVLRGPGGSEPGAAGSYVAGRIMQAAGFAEVINQTEIIGTATGGSTSSIILAGGASSAADFYKGMPIQHANIGAADSIRGTSLIRGYDGTSKTATLMETLGAAVAAGQYRIPPSLTYLLTTGLSIPMLSAKVWRHKKAYRYRDCALNAFAINIPVANNDNTDLPSIEFSMFGVPVPSIDELCPPLTSAQLSTPAPAKDGKFTFNGIKLGHQTLRLEFSLETAALPNQNFVEGQESYEIMSGTRTVTLDLNEQLVAQLDIDALTDSQVPVPLQSGWGSAPGRRFLVGVPNGPLDAFSPAGRNGFVGLSGGLAPSDVDRSIALSVLY
jgi:hypothetical protein